MEKHKIDKTQYPPKWDENKGKFIIEIETMVNVSESKEKVEKGIKNIFPKLNIETNKENILTGTSSDETVLFHFCELIFNQKIMDVARKCVLDGVSKEPESSELDTSTFYLNKQVASKNKISFTTPEEAPLGPIIVRIKTKELNLFIDSYFPKYEWFK